MSIKLQPLRRTRQISCGQTAITARESEREMFMLLREEEEKVKGINECRECVRERK